MLRDIKYLFVGLIIGAILFAGFIGAVAFTAPTSIPTEMRPEFLNSPTFVAVPPVTATQALADTATIFLPDTETQTPTVEPTLTFTETPTLIPFTATITDTPTVTATLSPGQVLQLRGDLAIIGPRSAVELIRLYETSLQFEASTFSDAKRIGEKINGKGYGSPTLICGPLSISILSTSGLLQSGLIPYKFWLLNPNDGPGRQVLNIAFPSSQYSDTRLRTRIDEIDWKSHPLMPGDFVYLYAGPGGNFEHMLVVNRVDSAGRAYSVTNYNPGDGFVIQEVMLYDPADPGVGMFHEWTKRQYQITGSTGYDGLEVWRLIAP
jgi:hypothetical protein